MKRIFLVALLALNVICFGQKMSFSSAIEYNDYLVSCINEVDQAYVNSLTVGDGKQSCMAWADSLNKITTRNLSKLKLVTPFGGEKDFMGASNNFIKYMNKISKKSLTDFDKLLFADVLTDPMAKKMDAIAKKLDGDYGKYFDKIGVTQKDFSVKYGFTIGQ